MQGKEKPEFINVDKDDLRDIKSELEWAKKPKVTIDPDSDMKELLIDAMQISKMHINKALEKLERLN